MFRNTVRYTALALAFVALFGACKKDETAAATPAAAARAAATPDAAIQSAVAHLRAGDVKALVTSQVPPSHLEEMRANWKKELAEDPPTEQEKTEFQAMMAELTAPDAETKLMDKLEPQLSKFETEYAPQMPMMIASATAASAAASTITKIENTDPWIPAFGTNCENATKLMFAAFRISSTPMRIDTALRRVNTV